MGKGQITGGGADGLYNVTSIYRKDLKDDQISELDDRIAYLEAKIPELDPGSERDVMVLQLASAEKRKEYLNTNMPDDIVTQAYCADLTEDLSGIVGMIEVPGEKTNFNIWPGFAGESAWDADRDGQLTPTVTMSPSQAYYNISILPGWQKWKPTFRYGEITDLNGDLADVTLEDIPSSQQGLGINQTPTLADVTIEYMSCNGFAFEIGDSVLIMFTDQDWATPKIIGFKTEPKPCEPWLEIRAGLYISFYKINSEEIKTDIPKNGGGVTSSPALISEISDWYAASVVSAASTLTLYQDQTYINGRMGAFYPITGGNVNIEAYYVPTTLSPLAFPGDYRANTTDNLGVAPPSVSSSSGKISQIFNFSLPCTDPDFNTTGSSFLSVIADIGLGGGVEYSRKIYSDVADDRGYTVESVLNSAIDGGTADPNKPGFCWPSYTFDFTLTFYSPFAAGSFYDKDFYYYQHPTGDAETFEREVEMPLVNNVFNKGQSTLSNQYGICSMGLEYLKQDGATITTEYDPPQTVCFSTKNMIGNETPWDMTADAALENIVEATIDANSNPTTAVDELASNYVEF